MGGPIRSKRTGIVVVMSGFTVHFLESKMDYLNDQESKFLSSVKAREIRRTQRLPFVISGVSSGSHLCGSWGLQLQRGDMRCRINVFLAHGKLGIEK